METGLAGKTVIVTGGGSNIGKGIVLAFAKEGSKIAIVDKDEAQAKKTAAKAMELGAQAATVVTTDVTNEDDVGNMVKRVLAEFGRIDVLVNNVGRSSFRPFLEMTGEWLDRQIDINLKSTLNCTKAILPHMMQQGSGRVVNIGSESGRAGNPEIPVYSALKGAVIALTKANARAVGSYGITVNCVCPHAIFPDDPQEDAGQCSYYYPGRGSMAKAAEIMKSPDGQKELTSGHAVKRLGRPADIAAAVVFLASEAAGYITGQPISVNGGETMM